MKEKIEVKNLDHLGIIAGIVDEIGIESIVNESIGIDRNVIKTFVFISPIFSR